MKTTHYGDITVSREAAQAFVSGIEKWDVVENGTLDGNPVDKLATTIAARLEMELLNEELRVKLGIQQ